LPQQSIHVRRGREEDIPVVARVFAQAFGGDSYDPEGTAARIRREVELGVSPENSFIAEKDGKIVGTATGIPFETWVGGAKLRLMGIAGVATGWEARRQGVARALMLALLDRAKEEGFHLMGLYPFRPSFYQAFGFGSVEMECHYTIPTTFLPESKSDARELFDEHLPLVQNLYDQAAMRGSFCNLRRSKVWEERWNSWKDCMRIGIWDGSEFTAYAIMKPSGWKLQCREIVWNSTAGFRGLLGFLRSLSDQYTQIELRLPADVALMPALKETQFWGPNSDRYCYVTTEGMAKLVDLPGVFQARSYPKHLSFAVRMVVADPVDGGELAFDLELSNGSACVSKPGATSLPEVRFTTMSLAQWFLGTYSASALQRVGALETNCADLLPHLDEAAAGPMPYNRERY